MKLRILSAAVILLLIGLSIYFFGSVGLIGFTSLSFLIASFELRLLLFGTSENRKALINRNVFGLRPENLFIFLLWLMYSVNTYLGEVHSGLFAVVFIVYCSGILFLNRKSSDVAVLMKQVSIGNIGFLYLGVLPISIIQILNDVNGMHLFIGVLFIVYLNDTFAYLVGRKFGKDRIFPHISPKKTLQGWWGGTFGSFVGSLILIYLIYGEVNINLGSGLRLVFLGILTGLASQMGDFWESLLKRVVDVKDSGSLLPGHGGVLDRVDSLLFACPIFLQGFKLLFRYF